MAYLDFQARFQQLEAHRDLSNGLIRDILQHYTSLEAHLQKENQRLTSQLDDTLLELEDARKSRRELQRELGLANQTIDRFNHSYDSFMNRNPYVIVLIDGDGMIFHEKLIRKGLEGGKQAANALRDIVLEQCHELANEMEVVAKVCANVTRLSKAMLRDGSLQNTEDLRDFTLGFTQGKASFDFVDVGHGKERADSKIKECMRWHLRNHNCKQILLGISHDAGYAPFLDEIIATDEDKSRITIIEGPPIVRELTATNLQIMPLNNIFRTDKLIDRAEILTDRVASPQVPNGAPTWAKHCASIPPAPNAAVVKPAVVVVKPNAVVVKNGTNGVKKGVPALRIAKPLVPAWTPEPRGLDERLNVNKDVLETVKRRTNSDKLCNNHYLRGPCAKGDECCFEHDHKCTLEELNAISFLARLNPCLSGQECDVPNCIYGHHCPSVVNIVGKKPVCTQFACKFGEEDHPPGSIIKHPKKPHEERYFS